MADIPTYKLNDGTTQPVIGFGTYPMVAQEAIAAVGSAFKAGYRLIDTAQMYRNEDDVKVAFRESGLARDQVQFQTKISGGDFGEDYAMGEIQASLGRVGVDRLDMVLIHWPVEGTSYVDQWKALIASQQMGIATSIGVSNFNEEQLRRLIAETGVTPAVNQIELHPLMPQHHMREVHAELGIITQAWSPLGKERAPYEAPAVQRGAREHNVTPAQVILRWHLDIGTLPLPKSANPDRQRANIDLFGWHLTADEISAISALGQ